MSRILVVDDDPHIARTMEIMLRDDGHEVTTAASGEEGLECTAECGVDIALVDLQLPGMSGTEVLRELRKRDPNVAVIIITAYGSIETAVEAMKQGAFDYLTKPFSPDQVRHRLQQIERVRSLQSEVVDLKRRVGELPFRGRFATESEAVQHLLEVAESVAETDARILIRGESGTGKTLLARLIHAASSRSEGPFATVDCTSLKESLLESELFGHARGAFTGAVADKQGKVEIAEGGTLFFDEIGEVPLHLQGKLLRLIEDRIYEQVGDPTPRTVDARVIVATNRDLESMVRENAFREDLFYRLSVVELSIPALRNRPEDILPLARDFLSAFADAHSRLVRGWDAEVEQVLLRYPWPGNVRELANTVERAVLLCQGGTLHAEHLPERLSEAPAAGAREDSIVPLAEMEERLIREALGMGLPIEETARRLGIDPSTLWRKRKKYNI